VVEEEVRWPCSRARARAPACMRMCEHVRAYLHVSCACACACACACGCACGCVSAMPEISRRVKVTGNAACCTLHVARCVLRADPAAR
jgi:hypothetical protein